MPNSATYDKLKQIGEEIAQIKDPREFGRRLKYEFMDFIEGHPELHKEYMRRTGFYENLPNTMEFQSLFSSIHDGFKELHRRTEAKKLPPQPIFVNQARATPEEKSRLTMQDYYMMLSSRKPWPKFDEMNATVGVYISGRISPPWDRTLNQYELIEPFIMEAENAGAVRGGQETSDIALKVIAEIQSLRALITAPLLRWHLHAFYQVKFYGQDPDFITSVDTLSKSVSRVCSELLFHVKELEEQRKSSRKKPKIVKSIIRGILTTATDKEIPFKMKKAKTAILCEKVYGHCRQVGDTVRIEIVFNEVWKGGYEIDQIKNWKTVDDTARNVNKWAKKHGLPDLLQCTTEHVERLA